MWTFRTSCLLKNLRKKYMLTNWSGSWKPLVTFIIVAGLIDRDWNTDRVVHPSRLHLLANPGMGSGSWKKVQLFRVCGSARSSEVCLEVTEPSAWSGEWNLRFLFWDILVAVRSRLRIKPRRCLGNLADHLKKEKQTSCSLAMLAFYRCVLEKQQQRNARAGFGSCSFKDVCFVLGYIFL